MNGYYFPKTHSRWHIGWDCNGITNLSTGRRDEIKLRSVTNFDLVYEPMMDEEDSAEETVLDLSPNTTRRVEECIN